MKQKNVKKQNRIWLVLNYASLVSAIILFHTGKGLQWPIIVLIAEIALVMMFVLSFINAFIKSKLWKFVHSSDTDLDEREILVVLTSLKYAYSVFTILCLIIIYGFALAAQGPIDVLTAGALLYLAHTLPASIIGWQGQ